MHQETEVPLATPHLRLVSTGEPAFADAAASHVLAHDDEAWSLLLASIHKVRVGRLAYFFAGKRLIDVVCSLTLLALAWPFLVALVLAVRFDSPGGAIFRQTRVGRGGKQFTVYKLRTMRTVAPGEELAFFQGEDGKVRHKVKGDPRVTRVGALLRKTSLDELPQLINVLRGDMSLVGPRPELPQIVQNYEPWQHRRHLVRPGITGWWQVSGRGDLPMHENTGLDLHYVDNLSLGLDLRILARTVKITLKGIGAF